MGRLRTAAGWQATVMLFAAPTAMAAPSIDFEQAMQMTLQLSSPAATEEERDLLRREYKLTQAASEFWVRFDRLNARIHETADIVRSMRGMIEGAPAGALSSPLLLGLDAASVAPAPPVTSPMPTQLSAPKVAASQSIMTWAALAAAVLGMLTLLFMRRQNAKTSAPSAALAHAGRAADTALMIPASTPPGVMLPAPDASSPATEDTDGLKRQTVPASKAVPTHADPVREEMDHALDLAEVMLSYGRTTGAMQALKDYLNKYPTVSVRPWLKLLDIYRQTGMREDFDRAAETVHRHFNVKVPGWDEGVSDVPLRSFFDEEEGIEILGLEQLPHILARIQATWPEPACLEYLRHLLVDNRDGGRMGFPVSVVAEILLLEDVLDDRFAGHARQH
ncbi:MAG: hypothetical protein IPG33_07070 [Betaproteobacteria bacterium]|nr:hypothetical protein [Betaproteobacteria bacterium]